MELANRLEAKRLTAILSRVLPRLPEGPIAAVSAFTPDEKSKLCSVLEVSLEELDALLHYCVDVFRRAAYNLTKPAALRQQLVEDGLGEEQAQPFAEVWALQAKEVVDSLKSQSCAPSELVDVNWRLNLTLGQSTKSSMRAPNAVLELAVADNEVVGASGGTPSVNNLEVEFTHEELYAFFQKVSDHNFVHFTSLSCSSFAVGDYSGQSGQADWLS